MFFNIQRFAAVNELPSNLTIYECYHEGNRYVGLVTIDLPEFSNILTDINGAGIAGDFSMPSPGMLEDMEITLHWHTPQSDVTFLLGHQAHELTLMGSQNVYDSGTGKFRAQPIKIMLRGVPHKLTLGKFERASETDTENSLGIDYIKISIDGSEVIEYDKFNFVFRVNGQDFMAGTRTAIGRN